jgi:hypothetical protein
MVGIMARSAPYEQFRGQAGSEAEEDLRIHSQSRDTWEENWDLASVVNSIHAFVT